LHCFNFAAKVSKYALLQTELIQIMESGTGLLGSGCWGFFANILHYCKSRRDEIVLDKEMIDIKQNPEGVILSE